MIAKMFRLFLLFILICNGKIATAPCSSQQLGTSSSLASKSVIPNIDKFGVLMADGGWAAPCCGVVTMWQMKLVDADTMFLQIWRPVNPGTGTYRLIGENSHSVSKGGMSTAPITNPSLQIPVKQGDVLGWYADLIDNLWYTEQGCSGSCTSDYYEEDLYFSNPYGIGQAFSFTTQSGTPRDYAIKATVEPGEVPTVTNLPDSVDIWTSETVDSVIHTVKFIDLNSLDSVQVTLSDSDPPTALFALNSTTGDVTVSSDLNNKGGTYILMITATDGCNTSPAKNLTVNVMQVTTTEELTTTTIATTAPEESTTVETTLATTTTTPEESTTIETTLAATTTTPEESTTVETTLAATTTTPEEATTIETTLAATTTAPEKSTTVETTSPATTWIPEVNTTIETISAAMSPTSQTTGAVITSSVATGFTTSPVVTAGTVSESVSSGFGVATSTADTTDTNPTLPPSGTLSSSSVTNAVTASQPVSTSFVVTASTASQTVSSGNGIGTPTADTTATGHTVQVTGALSTSTVTAGTASQTVSSDNGVSTPSTVSEAVSSGNGVSTSSAVTVAVSSRNDVSTSSAVTTGTASQTVSSSTRISTPTAAVTVGTTSKTNHSTASSVPQSSIDLSSSTTINAGGSTTKNTGSKVQGSSTPATQKTTESGVVPAPGGLFTTERIIFMSIIGFLGMLCVAAFIGCGCYCAKYFGLKERTGTKSTAKNQVSPRNNRATQNVFHMGARGNPASLP